MNTVFGAGRSPGKHHFFGVSWYDYGARFYDPVLGRFTTIDPLIEKFKNWSPYVFALNNPIRLLDSDGAAPYDPNKLREAADYGYKEARATFNKYGMACSTGFGFAFEKLTGTNEFKGSGAAGFMRANEMRDHMKKNSNNWESLNNIDKKNTDFEDIQKKANEGYLVVAVVKDEETGIGHVEMVIPGETVPAGYWGLKFNNGKTLKVPTTMNPNKPKSTSSLNYDWGKDFDPYKIEFYLYKGNDQIEKNTNSNNPNAGINTKDIDKIESIFGKNSSTKNSVRNILNYWLIVNPNIQIIYN